MVAWLSRLIMGATLVAPARLGIRKTALPRPHQREAAGDHRRRGAAVAVAVRGRRLAHDVLEGGREPADALEADVERDLRDGLIGLAQQVGGALDPAALQVAVRGLAELELEGADEVRVRGERGAGQRRNVERFGVMAVDL